MTGKTDKKSSNGLPTVNQTEAAACLGVSTNQFRAYKLTADEKIGREMRYSIPTLLRFFADKETSKLRKRIEDLQGAMEEMTSEDDARQYQKERTRLTKEQADGQELKNAQLRAELVSVELAMEVFAKILGEMVTKLDAAKSKLPTRLTGLSVQQIDAIARLYDDARNSVADLDPDEITDEIVSRVAENM